MATHSRREFLLTGLGAMAMSSVNPAALVAQRPGERPPAPSGIEVINPRGRVPVGLIIDDSTCLVNMAHYAMPQFAVAWPDRASYKKAWWSFPREIPDDFVRKFGHWCGEVGLKGKYSIVPYPSCVGRLDRFLPGWSSRQLADSIELVRTLLMPGWDIHPEMVTHTVGIDIKTGIPMELADANMENSRFSDGKSVDELASYFAYALQILKNVGLDCEGITTPGGFGNRVKAELSQATFEACRDVFSAEIPHYFKYLSTGAESVAPRVEYASGIDGPDPRCTVSVYGCTGDWFGGWDGDEPGSADQFITADLAQGRMVDVIERGEPAFMVGHWPGFYLNGVEWGFAVLKETVRRLHARFDNLLSMKTSELARYWAAKELTRIGVDDRGVAISAPLACPNFTVRWPANAQGEPRLAAGQRQTPLRRVARLLALEKNTWTRDGEQLIACFDLPKGPSRLMVG